MMNLPSITVSQTTKMQGPEAGNHLCLSPHYQHALHVFDPSTTLLVVMSTSTENASRRLEYPLPATGGKMQFWGIWYYEEQTDKRGVSAHGSFHDPYTPNQLQGPKSDLQGK
jgi:hypothetical protein